MTEELPFLVADDMRKGGAPTLQIEEHLQSMKETMKRIAEDPVWNKEWLSDKKLARNTYRYWDSVLTRRSDIALLKLSVPILIVHGELDAAVPIASADALKQAFARAGKTNLEYRRIPAMGHSVNPAVLEEVSGWLLKQGASPRRGTPNTYLDQGAP